MFTLEIYHKEELIAKREMLSASAITEKMGAAIYHYAEQKKEVLIRLKKDLQLIMEVTEKYFENAQ